MVISSTATRLKGVAKILKRRNHAITRTTFMREMEALRELVHPNIVRLLDVVSDEERGMIIITDFCPAGTLLDLVLKNASSHSRAWGNWIIAFFRQLVAAVAFIHKSHFVHLDHKSSNVVLDVGSKVPILIDFGLAVKRSEVYERSISGVQGTFRYMAPEVLDRTQHPYAGGKADVWSLGCLLFEMIEGFLPSSVPEIKYLEVKQRIRRDVWSRLRRRPGALETCLWGEDTFEESQKQIFARILWIMLDPEAETRADIWQVQGMI
ncbi:maternal embryonic leucine zipper kinase-like [Oratosquilla oratoria]|uniref:maternal embryonic leucine zipper kinase-like n=1 Tax=Oratosquilla oratoria TaxID=337810 RepID=UPI003F769B6F